MGQLVNDSKEKAQLLVEQFQSVFTRDDDQRLPDTKKRARRPISPLHITTNGVEKLLHGINTAKAQAPDRIANIMLKTCASQLAPALTNILQRSIDCGKLPSDWLNANVSPVYKKGDVHLPSLNHGFRSGYSCETQLVTTVHGLLGKFDSGSQIGMIILNFSKAFDTLPHSELLHKM